MTYMTKEEIWAAALRQSAVDLNCSPEDFGREHSVVVRSAPHAGARKYLSLPFFCDLVSYGGNVVASVAPEAEAAVRAYVERYAGRVPTATALAKIMQSASTGGVTYGGSANAAYAPLMKAVEQGLKGEAATAARTLLREKEPLELVETPHQKTIEEVW